MEIVKIDTDVLCVGGGIAGLMAAIRASKLGAKVVIAEKGNAEFSGSGRAGNDHFWAYIPEKHADKSLFIKETMLGQMGYMLSGLPKSVVETWVERSEEMVELWDQWGIPMRQNGKMDFSGHAFPGRMLTHIKYQGANQKKALVKQAKKSGAEIMNRIMVFDLLGDINGVTGAVGIHTRENKLYVFNAKSVVLGTGVVIRLYPNVIPSMMANNTRPFTTSGDGRAMAYRLGAELSNMEMINNHAGVKNYARAGQGSWPGVCSSPDGKPIGKYINKPDSTYGDIIMEVDKRIFKRHTEAATGPVYMDCRAMTDAQHDYLLKGLRNEGNSGLLDHLKEEGLDLRKNALEFSTYEIRCSGRIEADANTQTSIPGLFATGEETTYSISGAAVFGWIGGENGAKYSQSSVPVNEKQIGIQVENAKQLIETFTNNSDGTNWFDANTALNHTLKDYAGPLRSGSMLKAGLKHLRNLKSKLYTMVAAKDRWELTRCLEVKNLYDLGEVIFVAALEREESRGLHQRIDFPYTDPLLNNKVVTVKNIDGLPTTQWKEIGN